ncbi:MAG: hypothetical protein ACKOYJ_09295 [Planctomycetia bacterium]
MASLPLHHRAAFARRLHCRRGIVVLALMACWSGTWPTEARGQDQADGSPSWKNVEASQQFKDVVTALKGPGPLTDEARAFLEQSILPQLESDANRATLDDTRKKIRDRILLVIGNDAAFTEACQLVRDRMGELARNDKVDPIIRVQAMMLVADLVDKARLPWTPALKTLAEAALDASLAPGPRAAAMVGIANHASALNRLTGDPAKMVKETVVRVLSGLLTSPVAPGEKKPGATRPVDVAWMASRGLSMLPQAMSPTTPEMAAILATTIDDASWPIDVRVRAAMALGRTAGPESGVDGPKIVAAIKELAIAALESDRADAKQILESRAYKGGGGGPAMQPRSAMPAMPAMPARAPAEDGLRESVCRRAAWRLYALGDAIDPKTSKGGLASLLGKNDGEAKKLATSLKEAGEALDAAPYGDNLLASLDTLDPAGAKRRAAEAVRAAAAEPEPDATGDRPEPEQDGKPPADDKPAPKPDDSPSSDPFG